MRLFRRRQRLRALSERDCYVRLHGGLADGVRVLPGEIHAAGNGGSSPAEPAPQGPTEQAPALHLVVRYPRGGTTVTGEEVRLALLQRMESRPRRSG